MFSQEDYFIYRYTHLQIWYACLNSPSLYKPLKMADHAKDVRLPYSTFISQPFLDQRPKHEYQLLSFLKLSENHTMDRGFLAKLIKTHEIMKIFKNQALVHACPHLIHLFG